MYFTALKKNCKGRELNFNLEKIAEIWQQENFVEIQKALKETLLRTFL